MNNRKNKLLWFVILVSIMLFPITSCEPRTKFEIRNDTNQTLDIYIAATMLEHVDENHARHYADSVEPGQMIKIENIPDTWAVYLVEARDKSGNIVYSKEFTRQDLGKIGWKVVITASK